MRKDKFISFICFALKQRSLVLGAVFILVALASCAIVFLGFKVMNDFWNEKLNTLFSFATFVVALAVWFGEAREDWLDSLPCKLTAVFIYVGKEVMRCNYANLSSEADMRALGQSVGNQMNNNILLKLMSPDIVRSGGHIEKDGQGEIFRHWVIQFTLRELPITAKVEHVLLWSPPFTSSPKLVACSS